MNNDFRIDCIYNNDDKLRVYRGTHLDNDNIYMEMENQYDEISVILKKDKAVELADYIYNQCGATNNKSKKVYLASPFFDDMQIERMEKVRDILREKGLDVFVPLEHQHKELEFGSLEWRDATFKSDVKGIDDADIVVAIMSLGNFDDSGSAWEVGYAYAKGIPVVLVNLTGDTINLMIADSLHALITSYDELLTYDFNKLEKVPYLNYVW